SLLRTLADRVSPEPEPSLNLTSKPILDIIPKLWILLPLWSEVVDTPKGFYPDKPKPAEAAGPAILQPVAMRAERRGARGGERNTGELLRTIRGSRIRQGIWVRLGAAQILYMVAMA